MTLLLIGVLIIKLVYDWCCQVYAEYESKRMQEIYKRLIADARARAGSDE